MARGRYNRRKKLGQSNIWNRKTNVPANNKPANNKPANKKAANEKLRNKRFKHVKLSQKKAFSSNVVAIRRRRLGWSSNAYKLSDDELKKLGEIPEIPIKRMKLASEIKRVHFTKITTVHQRKFTVKTLLKLYKNNPDFRDVVSSDNYVYADGYLCLYSHKCLKYRGGKFHVKPNVKSEINDYCITVIRTKRTIEDGSWITCRISVKPAPKGKPSKLSAKMEIFTNTYGPTNFTTYGKALTYYMEKRHMDDYDMENDTHISSKSIERYRKDLNMPRLSYSVAICIALKLIPEQSYDMIALSGHSVNFGTEEGKAYRFLINTAFLEDLTVDMCNDLLKEIDLKPLT